MDINTFVLLVAAVVGVFLAGVSVGLDWAASRITRSAQEHGGRWR